jgi:hypothetical protein
MVTVVIIFFVLVIVAFITLSENYQKCQFVAKYIDGQEVTGNYISVETQAVVDKLKAPGSLKIRNSTSSIVLPDGQELYYKSQDLEDFIKHSKLNYEPNRVEWAILQGLVKKLVNR